MASYGPKEPRLAPVEDRPRLTPSHFNHASAYRMHCTADPDHSVAGLSRGQLRTATLRCVQWHRANPSAVPSRRTDPACSLEEEGLELDLVYVSMWPARIGSLRRFAMELPQACRWIDQSPGVG